ncbi:MCE family protein [Fodinicola acaciae]|uniref:MCE family protein n=1 Tax=Fodinicola acaciae TaxID=2681555 RepID=UPI0013D0D9E3|nr:MCE family protein [Fodinicola acaciae]
MTRRGTLAVRGGLALLLMLAATVALIVNSTGAFNRDPVVTATVPATGGSIAPLSSVQHHGVVVGTLLAVEAGTRTSKLVIRLRPAAVDAIPANVQVRLLPRTVFGQAYVDLVTPQSGPHGELRDGSILRADMSAETIQLYQAFNRIYDLLTALQPAQLDAALTAVADAVRGRGDDLGTTIAELDTLTRQLRPTIQSVGPNLRALATLSEQLAQSAPDAFHALDDAVAISAVIVQKQQSLRQLLSAGTSLADESDRLLGDNSGRLIQLVRLTGPTLAALSGRSDRISDTLTSLHSFLDKGNQVFASGRLKMRAPIVFPPPQAYSAADCPRYPGLAGPNCGSAPPPAAAPPPAPPSGGTAGPVGSNQEQNTIGALFPDIVDPAAPGRTAGLLDILAGPILRGSQVVTP